MINSIEINSKKISEDIASSLGKSILCHIYENKISLKYFLNNIEKNIILIALEIANGNQKATSNILQMKPTTLNEKLKKHEIAKKKIKMAQKQKINNKLKKLHNRI